MANALQDSRLLDLPLSYLLYRGNSHFSRQWPALLLSQCQATKVESPSGWIMAKGLKADVDCL